ncbi:MAG TPA: hypothetical protein VGA27_12685 [Candidatus Binatia bacterium]
MSEIAGNEKIAFASQGAFEKSVVVWISGNREMLAGLDPLRQRAKLTKDRFPARRSDAKLGPGKNLFVFLEDLR